MNLVRWNPVREMVTLGQAMDSMFDHDYFRPFWLSVESGVNLVPAIDMYETDNEIVVKATMPGVEAKELDINITGDTLTIKGETISEKEEKKENYYYQECSYGTFARSITLPAGVETDKSEASLDSGILTLTLPKAESVKPKSIKVKAKKAIEGKKEVKN
jgi:HSP20 family protein